MCKVVEIWVFGGSWVECKENRLRIIDNCVCFIGEGFMIYEKYF